MKKSMCFILLLGLLLSVLAGCGAKNAANEPMDMPQADNVEGKAVDMAFETAYMDMAISLLQQSARETYEENLMISPLSMLLALSMTANGAEGQTLQEMEEVLSRGIPVEQLNHYLYSYLYDRTTGVARDENCQLQIANALWIRDDKERLVVQENFLQSVSNYYDAEIYKTPFDKTALMQINNWVGEKTNGKITQVLDKIDDRAMLYLVNAISFEGAWARPYDETQIREGSFTNLGGKEKTVSMMHSEEHLYIADNRATGFVKPYEGGKYQFAVLVPNEGVELYSYMESMTASGISQTLLEAQSCPVFAQLPAFVYECDLVMNQVLKNMGMATAFDPDRADLSNLADTDLYISNVLHKTFICVDGLGTQAGAATTVEFTAKGSYSNKNVKEVIVDRPFVYMILDSENNLPIFIGCVTDIT